MSLAPDFRPEASDDVVEARRWYEEQEPRLGDAFADSLAETIERIAAMPRIYQVVHANVRRGKMRKFPYLIY